MCFLFVANEDAPALAQPGQRALDHPTPSRMTLSTAGIEFLLTDARDVRCVLVIGRRLTPGGIVVSLVEAQVLRRVGCRLGTLDHDRVERLRQQLRVVDVRRGDDYRERAAVRLDQEAALRAVLGPIRGVRADMIPPKRALPMAPSAACQSQFTPASSSHSFTSVAQMRSSTPFCSHRWKVRWTPLSSPNTLGR